MANGSIALSAAYSALGIKANDEVITTPRTFIATSSCAILAGAKPVFADLDEDSGLITPETIEPLITSKTKLISVVHLAGWPANMQKICELAKNYNLKVLEDCSQAHGAKLKINNKWFSVGSFGDIGTWSFCTDKIISTGGEGGMITTNNSNLWDQIWSLKDHGKTFSSVSRKDHPIGYKWLHERIGSNYRLTEIQSALRRIQLKRLNVPDDFSYNQKCKIISKGLKLKDYESLIKSLCLEKGNFFVNKNIHTSDIKKMINFLAIGDHKN